MHVLYMATYSSNCETSRKKFLSKISNVVQSEGKKIRVAHAMRIASTARKFTCSLVLESINLILEVQVHLLILPGTCIPVAPAPVRRNLNSVPGQV